MKRRKIISLLVISALTLSLSACGNSDNGETLTSESPMVETISEPQTDEESVLTAEPESETDNVADETTTEDIVTGPYEAELSAGNYYVGCHIPEGIYEIEVVSGLGTLILSSKFSSFMGSGQSVEYPRYYSDANFENGDVLKIKESLVVKITCPEATFSSMSSSENPAKKEVELEPGEYIVGQDIAAGMYDISIVNGTAQVNDYYSFSAMLTEDTTNTSGCQSYKNVELSEDSRMFQVLSGTVKLTPTSYAVPIEP